MTAFQEKIAKFADVKCFCYEENRFSHRRRNVGGEWIQDVPWQRRPLGERAVEKVATHEAWYADPDFVTAFYNGLRKKLYGAQPNEGHRLIAALEQDYDVTVVTQNVDNLHEKAGSHKVIHLHGELTKVCSTIDPYDPKYIRELSEQDCEVEKGAKAGDGSLLRPFIVFFGEAVPMIEPAAEAVKEADIFVVVGHVAQRLSRRRTHCLHAEERACLSHRPCRRDGERLPRRHPYQGRCVGRYAAARSHTQGFTTWRQEVEARQAYRLSDSDPYRHNPTHQNSLQ